MASSTTLPPRLDAIRLDQLVEGDPAGLDAHGSRDGERFTALDLSGRDLAGASFSECEFIDLAAHESNFRSARFVDTRFERLNSPIFRASRSRFRDVEIQGSRLGSAEFYDANWQSVHIHNCKLGFVNLRGAELGDVLFTNCTIEELDLGGAKAARVSFVGTDIRSLDVTQAKLEHADLRGAELWGILGLEGLRGATMNELQLAELARPFAEQFGIKIEG